MWGREFVDLVTEFPGVVTEPQQLFNILQRLTPRMYSIASSQAAHPNEVHTTVRVVRYNSHGLERQGVASGHLGERAPVGATLPIFLHENNAFRLPEDTSAPVIMIGPGTGIAPFRAFLEERQATGQTGDNWLFFGEQRSGFRLICMKDQFKAMLADGTLQTKLDTAFSRDTRAGRCMCRTVCRRTRRSSTTWLERGAYFLRVRRRDAHGQGRGDGTAGCALRRGSNGTLEHAAEYLAGMKKAKRYQRDVY